MHVIAMSCLLFILYRWACFSIPYDFASQTHLIFVFLQRLSSYSARIVANCFVSIDIAHSVRCGSFLSYLLFACDPNVFDMKVFERSNKHSILRNCKIIFL